jgi:preprotein translocase subunit SecY
VKRWIERTLKWLPEGFLWMIVVFVAVCILFAFVWFGTYSIGLRQ